ncbi:tripartite tricarboxylate transporter permease [Teichococcus vastitatis]|jgi:putative tricarboxylic transport membrane protein|uniref:Tripartite tricarboxylate transporter permease n=1 Tax=Teichococcus vastitatis TaxID=2307076 RepID=A0ABS9W2Q3_9PROT|nr:tripartite tricarboxylate transporter permease [Pseudoroseomonas vastitatis]MCI0753482.1 tripartite tricarboxylate transporter permease [Pseudoroseomonas vastitatis]
MGSFQDFLLGFAIALTPENLLYAFIGCLVGTLVGVLPGIGSAGGMIILLPLTYQLEPTGAIIMLAAIFYGSYYGGTISTVLMAVPGEVASVVTMLDGTEMARRGRAGVALSIAAIGSFVGGTTAVLALVLIAPFLTDVALKFGPPEFFALLFIGLATLALLAGNSMLRALAMAVFGLLLGTVGTDPTMGTPRFDLGFTNLLGGLDFVPVVMGLFGLSEILLSYEQPPPVVNTKSVNSLYPTRQDLRDSVGPVGRGTLLGFLLGLVPGTTQALASFISYGVEKAFARRPETFGRGAIQGVAGPETANNAHANAALIPLFTLGIPGSPSVAILLGAFIMNGLAPGPLLFSEKPQVVWPIIASMIIGNFMLLILNVPLVGLWVRILRIPVGILNPLIVLFICLGTYLVNNSVFDVWVMLLFGFLGVVLRKLEFPLAPIALTLIIGPLMEGALRQALSISRGNLDILVRSPLACGLLVCAAAVLTVPLWSRWARTRGRLGKDATD